jgi:DNA-binding transcriptional LysR family regulator
MTQQTLNLRSVDLNLLTVFAAVYEERNQARAAERLAMTQPAVSNAIARLRHVMRDELFVAVPRGVQPTPAGERLYPRVREALALVLEGLQSERRFDAATSTRAWTIGLGYGSGVAMGAPLLRWLVAEAPHARLAVRALDDVASTVARLRDGRLDVALDVVAPADADFRCQKVGAVNVVAIARRGHPRVGRRLRLEDFKREQHVTTCERLAVPTLHDPEVILREHGIRAVIELPSAAAIPAVVAQSDLIAIIGGHIAGLIAEPLGLVVHRLPFALPPVVAYLSWHASRDREPAHKWLRSGVYRVARDVLSSPLAAWRPIHEADRSDMETSLA